MEEPKERRLNIVMLPWLAHGHASPFLELAKKIGKRNHTIHVCSTKVILDSVKKRVNEIDHPFLHFIEIQLPYPPELPPHHHTTTGLPPHLNHTLMKTFQMAGPAFSDILKQIKPDLVICDVLNPWAHDVSASLSVPAIMFHVTSVAILCYGFHMTTDYGISKFPYPELIPQDPYWFQKYEEDQSKEIDVDVDEEGVINHFSNLKSFEIILAKTFGEIDEQYVDYTSSLIGKRVIPTGPLVKDAAEGDALNEYGKNIIEWLDKKEKASTVLVSFGSECYLSKEDRYQMAYGLEQSTVNFIWVIQFPLEQKIRIEESLPEGFLKRVGERGLMVDKWIPQARILAHESTGGFITHCGWGSITEAIAFGVPIISMPVQYDQPNNASMVVNAGVGVEVYRAKDGGFNGPEIARVTRELLVEDKGKEIRKKAREIKEKFIREGDDREIDALVKELTNICHK
ncbi:UDP-glucosyltransferase 29-like [Impatiens glandulifera]|uniref:UDP-glucosyltransferase 29-like n=1 Tax=Impatiens glandulifera TaxID=253017 RepID=UPI001FB1256C|nr:UDP-glucosyltransferase 29-like [Impatiens glandulifera]